MTKLKIREIFTSLQGEGPFSGQPALFIRLAGCNMEPPCSFCDTDYDSKIMEWGQEELAEYVSAFIANKYPNIFLIVITGGEPFMQDFAELIMWLRTAHPTIKIQIETNGTIDPKPDFPLFPLHVVVSPKAGASVKIRKIDAVKILVRNGDCVTPGNIIPTYLQPLDEKDPVQNKKNMDYAVQLCLKYGYRLSLQIHKILKIQ